MVPKLHNLKDTLEKIDDSRRNPAPPPYSDPEAELDLFPFVARRIRAIERRQRMIVRVLLSLGTDNPATLDLIALEAELDLR